MSKHQHQQHCEHDVKVCVHCDVAYCLKCSKEWGAPCRLNHYPYWWYSNPLRDYRPYVFSGSSSTATVPALMASNSHVHEVLS